MSKSVMLSIQPKWCELIASGKKTIEVRKSAPKLETPFKCYIYETKGKKVECGFHFEETGRTLRDKYVFGLKEARIVKHYCNEGQGKVIGEFVCDRIGEYYYDQAFDESMGFFLNSFGYDIMSGDLEQTCLSYKEFEKYGNTNNLYGWHISDLKIYDKPKDLSEIRTICEGIKCDGCEYYYVENNESIGLFKDCLCGCEKPMKKAPQSWCYIEELEK